MGWRIVSAIFVLLGIACFPVWPYAVSLPIYLSGFCFFVAVLTFLVSIFARRGSAVWKGRGQG
jgi:hypothetical protein